MSRPVRLLTAEEVADRLRTTPITIIRACRRGDLRATKPNRHWLISEDALTEYLMANSNDKDAA